MLVWLDGSGVLSRRSGVVGGCDGNDVVSGCIEAVGLGRGRGEELDRVVHFLT